jgi:hypothetical protein
MHGENLWEFTETRARTPRERHALMFCDHRYSIINSKNTSAATRALTS